MALRGREDFEQDAIDDERVTGTHAFPTRKLPFEESERGRAVRGPRIDHASDVVSRANFSQPAEVVFLWMREEHDIERAVPVWHHLAEFPCELDGARTTVDEQLVAVWRGNQRGVALPHIKEVDAKFAGPAIRREADRDCGEERGAGRCDKDQAPVSRSPRLHDA